MRRHRPRLYKEGGGPPPAASPLPNGKPRQWQGGGIAAVGLAPEAFGVTQAILENDYLLAIAYLDISCRAEVEREFIPFKIDHVFEMPHSQEKLLVTPPKVVIYFVKADSDQAIYENSYALNRKFYQADGEKKAFVLSHGKNLLVLKMVGYGNDVITYYQLENFLAHVWIGHHRYPTKGRVWHPGGAHPFIGLNEALVHNGDFANYFSMCEYLSQRNIHPLFLTDTEVAALLFDLLHRIYKYPLEYVIEALAPTTERDFTLLPEEKQKLYHLLQTIHMHGSPDGPWFFLVAQSIPQEKAYRLIGITDTSMLRPQVFALSQGPHPIGFAASEKQAIDATLQSLAKEDSDYWACPDYVWNARGGSHTDGGAFSFTVDAKGLACTDKFGRALHTENLKEPYKADSPAYAELLGSLKSLKGDALKTATKLLDSHGPSPMRRSSFRAIMESYIASLPIPGAINAQGVPSEGENSLARQIVAQYKNGVRKFILTNCQGQRFIGSGLGPGSDDVQIHVYGSSGDYLASGIDGAEIHVHGDAQDQLAQIMLSGTLIVHGNVGQTFLYGAKGGKAFVRGNTAGRPLINAVGNPRVVINGTCLDYLAESFMAGNPLKGGGFVIVNALTIDQEGQIQDLETPYPGSNLFSLASGGAVYLRDPKQLTTKGQLNGGEFAEITVHDWELILPYLEENAAHFDIPVKRLLEYEGKAYPFHAMYRKIAPIIARSVQDEEAWVKGK